MNRTTRAPETAGALFVVATPIGNLADITLRALDALRDADLILAEDTRRARVLLRHHGIGAKLQSFHSHNESAQREKMLAKLAAGARIALISDAGTPLLSDPGGGLVRVARERGLQVIPLPGANAAIAALSAAGQPAARFCFEGFLPPKAEARDRRLRELQHEPRTLIFYEASHRIGKTLPAMREIFGAARAVSVAREISKKFETFYCGALGEVAATIAADARHRKGEFVIVLRGADPAAPDAAQAREVMRLLMPEMPLKRASKIAAEITGGSGREMYALGVELRGATGPRRG
ncbi:MAG: 16S rRNA (cytidine(1402)-2'-O)-methyltransferase [Gammaproteobacteria bacterium]|nr:16S rRNA (cytidine(1402)-2'-O)-methyltransferase [Gammaproteobacteria bacterium]